MALEATHIRFALDLKDEYKIKDIGKYIRGTVYPDSRYVSKIDRRLTHNEEILKSQFREDDFKKGWQVHQVCDLVQNEMMKKDLGIEISFNSKDFNEKEWIIASSIKIIQDMNDLKSFDLQNYLKHFEEAENPNKEKIEDVKKFNNSLMDLYRNKEATCLEDYFEMLFVWGISEKHGIKIKEKTEEFLDDKAFVEKINALYDKMLDEYWKFR